MKNTTKILKMLAGKNREYVLSGLLEFCPNIEELYREIKCNENWDQTEILENIGVSKVKEAMKKLGHFENMNLSLLLDYIYLREEEDIEYTLTSEEYDDDDDDEYFKKLNELIDISRDFM